MLGQPGSLSECFRRTIIFWSGIVLLTPHFGFQGVDPKSTGHAVYIAATKGIAQIFIFLFNVQAKNSLSGFPQIGQKQLHKIGLALARVTQNQRVAVGLVIAAAVQVNQDIGTILISADVEPPGICFAGEIKGEQVCNGAGRENTFILGAEAVAAKRSN